MERLILDPTAPAPEALARAAAVIGRGGVAIIPTDTLYGLAADPFDAGAVARLFALKGRAADQAVPLIAASEAEIERALGRLGPAARRLGARFWPGPLTLLVPAPAWLAAEVSAGTGRVGVRVPAHAAARALCAACGGLLTATSANRSGHAPSNDADGAVAALFGRGAPPEDSPLVLVDGGLTPGGPPSTIVDVSAPRPVLVRAGAIAWEDIVTCLALE